MKYRGKIMRPALRSLAAVVLLWVVCFLSVLYAEPMGGRRYETEEWKQYQRRLEQLLTRRPKGEFLSYYESGGRIHRQVLLWVKAHPVQDSVSGWSRRITVYVDDTSGHRVRSVPDQVLFEVEPPATIVGEARQRTTNGEASARMIYGAGQDRVTARVSLLPELRAETLYLPLDTKLNADLPKPRRGHESEQRMKPSIANSQAAQALREARQLADSGDMDRAGRSAFHGAVLFVHSNQWVKAAQAFASGEAEFARSRWAPMCAWGHMQALRRLDRKAEADREAGRLVKQYPDSIPAQFAFRQAGEIWAGYYDFLFAE
jgi:hypothetical protein